MNKNKLSYEEKTKIGEALFPIFLDGKMDKSDLLNRLQISERHRLKRRYLEDKDLKHKLIGKQSNR